MKLHQAIALGEGAKTRYFESLKALDKAVRNRAPFEGLSRTYAPLEDSDAEKMPEESKRIHYRVEDLVAGMKERFVELFDVTATHEAANQKAVADVTFNGAVLIAQAPVTYLLFLEKKLVEWRGIIEAMPVLGPEDEWNLDSAGRCYKSTPILKARTRKEKRVLLKIAPTEHHPGQSEVFDADVRVGTWTEFKVSGCLSEERRLELLKRCEALIKAVKMARETANDIRAEEKKIGETVFDTLFA